MENPILNAHYEERRKKQLKTRAMQLIALPRPRLKTHLMSSVSGWAMLVATDLERRVRDAADEAFMR